MQMAEDWKLYWDKTSSDGYGTEIYFSRVNDGTEEEHMPTDHYKSSGSMCISNNKTFRWSQNNKTWEEM